MNQRFAGWLFLIILVILGALFFLPVKNVFLSEKDTPASVQNSSSPPLSPVGGGVGSPQSAAVLQNDVSQYARTSSSTVSNAAKQQRLAEYVMHNDVAQIILQLNTTSDPADWYLSAALNKWCAAIGYMNTETVQAFRVEAGTEHSLGMIERFRTSCGFAAEGPLAAPNSRFGDLSRVEYPWKQARGMPGLLTGERDAATTALVALGANRELMASWLDSNWFSISTGNAPALADVPQEYRGQIVRLASCEASPDLCHPNSLFTAASCFTSGAQWCGAGSLSDNILASVPEQDRARLTAKASELVDAIVKGKVDRLVVRK